MLHIPIVHAHNVSKQLPREFCIQSENKVIYMHEFTCQFFDQSNYQR